MLVCGWGYIGVYTTVLNNSTVIPIKSYSMKGRSNMVARVKQKKN